MREMQTGAVVGPEESMVAGHQVMKLLGVKDWFEWNGRKFDLKIVCDMLIEPMPDVSEYEKDANMGCSHVAKLLRLNSKELRLVGASSLSEWVSAVMDEHDVIFNRNLEEMRNANAK